MALDKEAHALTDKLTSPLAQIIDKHKTHITALLTTNDASPVGQALNRDENIRSVATFCYPLLPGLVRMVVKEPAFIDFAMHDRARLLAQLAPPAASVQTM